MLNLKNLSKKTLAFGALYVVIKWTIVLLIGGYVVRAGLWKNEYIYFLPLFALIGISIFIYKNKKNFSKTNSKDTQ